MLFGLREQDLVEICQLLERYPAVEKAVLFGSRAKGTFKPGSDIDIAVAGSNLNHDDISHISFALNEDSSLPYFFDIVHLESITEKDLLAHIERVGRSIYSKKT